MKITREMNTRGYSSILASILYYLKTIDSDMSPRELANQISDTFWIKNGYMSSNMNRPKMVYDLCNKYHIENRGYDDIFSHARELYRPEDEISAFEHLLQADE